MKKPMCSECGAFNAMSRECRRHAPTMVPVPQANSMGQVQGYAAIGLFPATDPERWCCEFVVPEPAVVLQ